MYLNEKQKIELATANMFLPLYNQRMGAAFEVLEQGDSPDILCIDRNTDIKLNLEITLLEDLPGEIQFILRRGRQPKSPITGTPTRSFFEDVVPQLERILKKKVLSAYGSNTALVIRQTSPIWGPDDWQRIAEDVRKIIYDGQERNFGAGVWIICIDNSTWPASDILFCLSSNEG